MNDDDDSRELPTTRKGVFAPPSIDLLADIHKKLEVLTAFDIEEELTTWVRDWYEVAEHTPSSEAMAGRAVAFMLRTQLRELAEEICRSADGLGARRERCQSDEILERVAEIVAADDDVVYYIRTMCGWVSCFVPPSQFETMAPAWHRQMLKEIVNVVEDHIDDAAGRLLALGAERGHAE